MPGGTIFARRRSGITTLAVVALLSLMLGPVRAGPSETAPRSAVLGAVAVQAAMSCSDLRSLNFLLIEEAPTVLRSASVVAASAGSPEYCRVTGYVWPQVSFELRLPTTTWNGRYFQTGGGGFGGSIPINSCADALSMDFAVAANDMGHTGPGALWGRDNEQLRIDYAHRATHVTAVASKAIIEAFYGQAASHSYFRGCSTGGREGIMEATRYPADFDGVIAGHPAGPAMQGAMGTNWLAQVAARPDADGTATDVYITEDKAALLGAAVKAECDGIDGLVDGFIDDPRNCHFDPASLACPAGTDGPDCLTGEQVTAAVKLYDGARNSQGIRLYPGWIPYGSEAIWPTRPANSAGNANEQLRHLQFPKSPPLTYTHLDFDFDTDGTVGKLKYGHELYDPFDPDLSEFRALGGKLLLYHGWLDMSTTPFVSVDYYSDVLREMGGRAQVHDWFRLFTVPGMWHCGGNPNNVRLGVGGGTPVGPDVVLQMVDWVENGVAPEKLVASYFNEAGDTVVRTRPVFPYPTVARYDGSGSIDDASNFVPANPPVAHNGDIKWLFDPGKGKRD
jgi:feruloyl esterase